MLTYIQYLDVISHVEYVQQFPSALTAWKARCLLADLPQQCRLPALGAPLLRLDAFHEAAVAANGDMSNRIQVVVIGKESAEYGRQQTVDWYVLVHKYLG